MTMNIEEFISENRVELSDSLIDGKIIALAEQTVGVKFGTELTEYLTKYGYLAYKYIELYGMTAHQGLESDMVKQTLYLHQYFPATVGLVAIENQGDGTYCLVNERDEVFEYDSSSKELTPSRLFLFEYILQRFESAMEW